MGNVWIGVNLLGASYSYLLFFLTSCYLLRISEMHYNIVTTPVYKRWLHDRIT